MLHHTLRESPDWNAEPTQPAGGRGRLAGCGRGPSWSAFGLRELDRTCRVDWSVARSAVAGCRGRRSASRRSTTGVWRARSRQDRRTELDGAPAPDDLTSAEVHAMIDSLGDVGAALLGTDPENLERLYGDAST